MRLTLRRSFPSVLALVLAVPPSLSAPLASAQVLRPQDIRVHGQWLIEVRDRNGALLERREFHNDLQTTGAYLIGSILAGQQTAGFWVIRMYGQGGGNPCQSSGPCIIAEPSSPDSYHANTLTKSVASAGLTLSGSLVVPSNGVIAAVGTSLSRCSSSTTPLDCARQSGSAGNSIFVTATNLPAPLAVSAGQQVQVSVVLSFTSAPEPPATAN